MSFLLMCQNDVLKVLRSKRRWMNVREVSSFTDSGKSAVSNNLMKLKKQGLIERKYRNQNQHRELIYRVK